jgi:CRISPR/Cas system-associated exonuclease Cas4 (RecB family)
MKMRLTKTDFKEYLICPKCLWLKKKRPDEYVEGEFSEFLKKLIKDGYEVEEYFKKFFPTGILVANKEGAALETKELIAKKATIFQATFKTADGIFAKIDVLQFDQETQKWNLYEVKSGSSIKTDLFHNHMKDIAFQKIVIEKSGIEIGKSFLVHLNSEYVRNGEIDLNALFVFNEVSDDILKIEKETKNEIAEALTLLQRDDVVTAGCGCIYASSGQRCDCFHIFNPEVPEYSTAHIFQKNKLKMLVDDEIFDPRGVPDDFKTTEMQRTRIELQQSGVPKIDKQAVREALAKLEYPLYFFDYETFGKPVPLLDGYKTSQQLVFQYSLHVLQGDGKLEHFEYLADDLAHATSGLLDSMRANIGPVGTAIVWYEPFEKGRNVELMKLHPEAKEFLKDLNSRVFDLMKVFKNDYLHPEFLGSASIKKVLPVLVPELSYKELDIQNGTMAIEAWGRTIFENVEAEAKEKIRKNLLKYCELDTLAMVKILEKLKEI